MAENEETQPFLADAEVPEEIPRINLDMSGPFVSHTLCVSLIQTPEFRSAQMPRRMHMGAVASLALFVGGAPPAPRIVHFVTVSSL